MSRPSRPARSPLGRALQGLARASALADRAGRPFADMIAELDASRYVTPRALERPDRRRFLEWSGKAALGVALAVRARVSFAALSGDPDVAVVGGGLAGLRAAHRLLDRRPTLDVRVYEGNERLGGRCYTRRGFFADDLHAELGGQFINRDQLAIQRLCQSLGLPLEEIWSARGREATYLLHDRHVKASAMQELWADSQYYRIFGDARRLAPWPPLYDQHNAEHVRLDRLTVNEWLDEVGIGAETDFGHLMQSTHAAEYGLGGDEGSALNLIYLLAWNGRSLDPLSGYDEAYQIEGGNDRLVSALAAEIGEARLHLGRELSAITGDVSGPYTLRFIDGSEVTAPKVILAIPHTTLRRIEIDRRIVEGFSPAKRRAIDELSMARSNKLQIQFDRKYYLEKFRTEEGWTVWPDGTVYTSVLASAVTCAWDETVGQRRSHPSTKGIVICFPGAERADAMITSGLDVPAEDQDVIEFVRQLESAIPGAATTLTGGDDPAAWRALASNWVRNPWTNGAYTAFCPGQWTSMNGAGEEVVGGNLHFAGEWTDIENGGFLEGAIASGERAAREVWRSS